MSQGLYASVDGCQYMDPGYSQLLQSLNENVKYVCYICLPTSRDQALVTQVYDELNHLVAQYSGEMCHTDTADAYFESWSYSTVAVSVASAVAAAALLYQAYQYATSKPETTPEVKREEVPVPTKNKVVALPHPTKLQLATNEINRAEAVLKNQALSKHEALQVEETFASSRPRLKNMTTAKDVDPSIKQYMADELRTKLDRISFEGKGVREEDKAEISYFRRAMIAIVEALKSFFSIFGKYVSEDHNPVAKAVTGQSFFIKVPQTPQEQKAIQEAKDSMVDMMKAEEAKSIALPA